MTTFETAKDRAKRSLAAALGSPRRSDGSDRTIILCYHSVRPDGPSSASPAVFREQLTWLKNHADVVPLAQIRIPPEEANGRPRVAITFDDGYADNWEHAFPLLVEHDLPVTFFVTAGLVDHDDDVIRRFAGMLNCSREDVRPLTWEQVREMRAAGAEIGAHTYSHPNFARLARGEILEELRRSREILEHRLQEPVTSLAYPFGKPRRHVSRDAVEAAAFAGYTRAVVLVTRAVRESDSDLQLPRIGVGGDSLETFEQKVTGAWDFLGWWHEHAPLWAAGLMRPGDASF